MIDYEKLKLAHELAEKYADKDEHLQRARESVARWLEYFKNISMSEPKVKQKPDWEPLHIGFRGDDD